MTPSLLPPNATPLERALEDGLTGLAAIDPPVEKIWDPQTCPLPLLPWLAYGLSVDLWDPDWSEAEKRAVVAGSIEFHRKKGTPFSLRAVLDRIDPAIQLVEWFDADPPLPPHHFQLLLPLASETAVNYNEDVTAAILRDIASVKPVRAHMQAVLRLTAEANAWLVSGAQIAGFIRIEGEADADTALNPIWATYNLTEDGEPAQTEAGDFIQEEWA